MPFWSDKTFTKAFWSGSRSNLALAVHPPPTQWLQSDSATSFKNYVACGKSGCRRCRTRVASRWKDCQRIASRRKLGSCDIVWPVGRLHAACRARGNIAGDGSRYNDNHFTNILFSNWVGNSLTVGQNLPHHNLLGFFLLLRPSGALCLSFIYQVR